MRGDLPAPSAAQIDIVEVGPRDGLQNESRVWPTEDKISLIGEAIAYGAKRIEVASFVNPRRVPQMADAEAVVAGCANAPGVTRIGLALNLRGAERALATGIEQVGAVAVASDAFGIRNQGQDRAESVGIAAGIVEMARRSGRSAQVTIAVAFGCPFEGAVDRALVIDIARALAAAQPVEIALADTIGIAGPGEVAALVAEVRTAVAPLPVRVHFHDTRNTANANIWAAVQAGASVADASLGGLGGCPFAAQAPGTAAGNIATEDMIYMLHRSGIGTGIDESRLYRAGRWLDRKLKGSSRSKVLVALPPGS
ncbi:hydroxymethylglutaryl-CoA lyase [Pacificimonas flava]|uniref:Hydroxymethylglutaryl-CoA lyase n=2 Tax=Pacificimonas TaxID=1960290 RepID=A0A219B2A5_9SPHN|nr:MULTISPECIES: hydroxymethylglutaryl-CoA lyase [Pacificimonas]MBZ6379587.1 hydroxymethylglutaryl-CoA lyase [Pacificimonas aurantium]OWV31939.1 hydroxymethylglutaryl-CoA lyase [Pacificimonas flava]